MPRPQNVNKDTQRLIIKNENKPKKHNKNNNAAAAGGAAHAVRWWPLALHELLDSNDCSLSSEMTERAVVTQAGQNDNDSRAENS